MALTGVVYKNLEKLLTERHLSVAQLARMIGASSTKTAENKLKGITDFTLDEAKAIMSFFPEYSMEWVFKRTEPKKQETSTGSADMGRIEECAAIA